MREMITAEDSTSLQGKRVLIAGGTTGIGRATAVRLVREGARVVLFGRDETRLQEGLADIEKEIANGGEVHGLTGDNAVYADVARAFAEVDAKLGGLDVFVGVAGVSVEGVADTDPEKIEYAVRANVTGYMFDAHEAIKRLKPQGKGHLVFIGSMSAVSRGEGNDIYVATKSANQGFAASLAKTMSKEGIKVSLIEPGLIGTDMASENHDTDEQKEMIAREEMLKAEDIASAVMYILSQSNRATVLDLRIQPLHQD